ncbi:MAG: hypothetical protein JWM80_5387 [Cyanobacteria bacterium RYN_339]|nr:hypothetical protein [Cyanobacteria bacterium RYN_339]
MMSKPRRFPALLAAVCLAGCTTPVARPATTPRASASPVVTAATPAPTGTAAPSPTPGPLLSTLGQVVGLDGKPAAGVVVRGFLLSDQGGAVIANNGAGIVSNNAGSYALLAAEPLETKTDADGRFTITAPAGQPINVEAAQSDDVKAIKQNVTKTDGLTLQLAFTGTLAGQVTAKGVSDLSGVDVFIPGTSYLAKTDDHGGYRITNVPVGTFTLYGRGKGVGKGRVDGVEVKAKATASAPDLVLTPVVPTVTAVAPANAGPGATVTITGTQFGATTGETFEVRFEGTAATQPKRKDDHTIEAVVPAGATTGGITVTLDGISSAPSPFTVLKGLAFGPNAGYLPLGFAQPFGFIALDTGDQLVEKPALAWKSDAAAITVDDQGLVKAAVEGKATLTARSGSVVATLVATVVKEPVLCTLAGGPELAYVEGPGKQARFKWVGAVAVGKRGTVFACDFQNKAIRAIRPDGLVGTAAGGSNSTLGLGSSDATGGLAVDDQDNLYVNAGSKLIKVAPDGTATPIAGGDTEGNTDGLGAAARFEHMGAIVRAGDGTLYVAEGNASFGKYLSAHRIRKIAPDGQVTTVAGSTDGYADGAAAKFSDIKALGLDAQGMLYASDKHGLRKIAKDGTVSSLPLPVGAQVSSRIAVDAAGNIFMADYYTGANESFTYRRIAPDGTVTVLGTVKGYGKSADGPASLASDWGAYAIALDPDGNLVTSNYQDEANSSQVKRILLVK